jgi:ferredoxin
MASVTLLKPDMSKPRTVEVRSQEKRTLLSLLMQQKLFDPCICERKLCGECAVKVVPKTRGREARPVSLDDYERKILLEAGKLSREQYEAKYIPASPSLWRLACQYVLRYEEIIVAM